MLTYLSRRIKRKIAEVNDDEDYTMRRKNTQRARKNGVVSTVLQIDKKVEMISTIGILPGGRWINSSKLKMEVFSTKGDGLMGRK